MGEDRMASRDLKPAVSGVREPDERVARLISVVNGLSDDALYIASRDWFRAVMMGKPVLATAQNKRQQAAFDELLEAGFVHGDVERGTYGYRSTYEGRDASLICLEALSGPAASPADRQGQVPGMNKKADQ